MKTSEHVYAPRHTTAADGAGAESTAWVEEGERGERGGAEDDRGEGGCAQNESLFVRDEHLRGVFGGAESTAGAAGDEEVERSERGGAEDESLFIRDSDMGGVFGGNLRFRRLETSQIDELFTVLRHERVLNPHEVKDFPLRDALQRTATHCNTLQRTATHCNTLTTQ